MILAYFSRGYVITYHTKKVVEELMNYLMKNGRDVTIKEATQEDAEQIIDFYNVVGGETDFLSFGKDGFKRDVEEYVEFVESTRLEQNCLVLLATLADEIIGIASINSSQNDRMKHVGTLGIVVSDQFAGLRQGKDGAINRVGSHQWDNKKISLVTRKDNVLAIELYEKLGLEKEGLIKKDTMINGVYYNTLVMGLFIDSE